MKIEYSIKKESVRLNLKHQSIAFHNFGEKNKNHLEEFKKHIAIEKPQNIERVFYIAKHNKVQCMAVTKRIIV